MELYGVPENLSPPGEELRILHMEDGPRLRAARWRPTSSAASASRGTVCVFQGRAECIEKYYETIEQLLARGFTVAALDWRGQGGSDRQLRDGRKGHVDDFRLYQRDLDAFQTQFVQPHCPEPYYALGHSMGAAILLAYASASDSPYQRLALTAPMIEIAAPAPQWAARIAVKLLAIAGMGDAYVPLGRHIIHQDKIFEGNRLTSDARRHARNLKIIESHPELEIEAPTIGWTAAAFQLMRKISSARFAQAIQTPSLIFAAGSDQIVSTPAILRFAQKLSASEIILLAGARHEILQEKDEIRALFWAAFDAFIPGETKTGQTSLIASDAKRSDVLL